MQVKSFFPKYGYIGIGSLGFHGFQLCFVILYLGGDEGVPGELVGCCLTKQHQFFLLCSHLTYTFSARSSSGNIRTRVWLRLWDGFWCMDFEGNFWEFSFFYMYVCSIFELY